jgi:DNA polymerase III delta prime subunit
MEVRDEMFLWVEKYRPQKIDDCVLPEALKKTFKEYISKGELPNFLLCGTAGTGKTTVAKALCNEIGAEYMFINGSEESGIDVLRTKIKSFASSVSLTDAKKVVILDEADYLNPNSTQPALRAFIEEFSNNCRFILTCNFYNKVIDPLKSRTQEFRFGNVKPIIIMKRCMAILKAENVELQNKLAVAEIHLRVLKDTKRSLLSKLYGKLVKQK